MGRLVFAAFSFHWRLAYADRSYCVSLFSCYFSRKKAKAFLQQPSLRFFHPSPHTLSENWCSISCYLNTLCRINKVRKFWNCFHSLTYTLYFTLSAQRLFFAPHFQYRSFDIDFLPYIVFFQLLSHSPFRKHEVFFSLYILSYFPICILPLS